MGDEELCMAICELIASTDKETFMIRAKKCFPQVTEEEIRMLGRNAFDMQKQDFPNHMDDSHIYCRIVNAVISTEEKICISCPLAVESEDVCRYFRNTRLLPDDMEMDHLPMAMTSAIEQGEETRFPRFLEFDKFPKGFYKMERALQYAADAHAGAFRKGTHLPYIIHPVEVAMIVYRCLDETNDSLTDEMMDIVVAAALHDVVEDTPHTIEEIQKEFGTHVASLVASESENKREEMPAEDSWKIRKQEFLDYLASASMDSKLIALADKLSNLRALAKDYARQGDALWQRFNQKDPKEHEWYYRSVLQKIQELDSLQCYQEYAQLLDQVFGDEEKNTRGGLPSKTKNSVSSLSDLQVDLQLLRLMFPDDDTLR